MVRDDVPEPDFGRVLVEPQAWVIYGLALHFVKHAHDMARLTAQMRGMPENNGIASDVDRDLLMGHEPSPEPMADGLHAVNKSGIRKGRGRVALGCATRR